MASRKSSRSSKTDHVLSLLAGAAPEQEREKQEPEKQEAASRPQAVADPQPAPLRPAEHLSAPILHVARTNNEALSRTIRDALSQALEEDLAQNPPQPAAPEQPSREEQPPQPEKEEPEEPAQPAAEETEEQPSRLAVETTEEQPSVVPAWEPQPEKEPEAREESPAPPPAREEEALPRELPAPEIPFAPRETYLPDGSVCLNIMEILVDERMERYVKMFGLCNCSRCLADVRALALTRLPAKYLVMPAQEAPPRVSLYRARYETDVIAQVIMACKTVMEKPRHRVT